MRRICVVTNGRCIAAVFGAAAMVMAGGAAAQAYPSKAITVLSTFQLGGSPEVPLRLIADDITKRTGKIFILESRPGGGGAVGLSAVNRAEPDGHTIAYTFTGGLLVNAYTTKDLGWDPMSFAPVGRIFNSPIIIIGDPKFPARTMADVIRMAKEKPETISIAIGGSGNKIGLAQLDAATGAKFIWVPIANQIRTNVLGSHVNLGIETPSSVKGLIDEGKVTAIGVGSLKRLEYMPNVPAIAETVPGFENGFWFGFLAPKGTPADRVAWLNREINTSLNTPLVLGRMKELALDPIIESPQQFDAYLRKTGPEFESIIKKYNIN
jgi:tripartite-type tricarboxylate transporter receptor subunit TctC